MPNLPLHSRSVLLRIGVVPARQIYLQTRTHKVLPILVEASLAVLSEVDLGWGSVTHSNMRASLITKTQQENAANSCLLDLFSAAEEDKP